MITVRRLNATIFNNPLAYESRAKKGDKCIGVLKYAKYTDPFLPFSKFFGNFQLKIPLNPLILLTILDTTIRELFWWKYLT